MNASETDLQRFVAAQEPVYRQVCEQLAAGRKTGHWMWFVFPQLRGLGLSATARYFGIASRDEALAYWQHPVLGPRLKQCAARVLGAPAATAHDIFGSPDELKLRSCMTLFAAVAPEEPVFAQVLDRFYGGKPDPRTRALLGP